MSIKNGAPSVLGVGMAIFSMFFGAGNSIFPLYVGYCTGNGWIVACFGLLLTAVLMPILGIVAMRHADGNQLRFFSRLGRIPGLLIALFVVSLLGPFGSTPRCIALSYATLIDGGIIPMPLFAILSCTLLFFVTKKKAMILPLVGYILTPILLVSLCLIIGWGLLASPQESVGWHAHVDDFSFGLAEGYKTMDLLAAFFFSSTILHLLDASAHEKKPQNTRTLLVRGGILGGIFLALIYTGFCLLAAKYASALQGIPQHMLLKGLAEHILGPYAALVVKIAVAVACLTTAIALLAAFVDFIDHAITRGRVSYEWLLFVSLCITCGFAVLEFSSLSSFLSPLLALIYPGLILLTLYNVLVPFRNTEATFVVETSVKSRISS